MVTIKQLNNLMLEAVKENVFPGGALLVSKEGRICFFEAFGYANIFSRREMTRDMVFDLASLTKPLATTMALMKLVEQKKLDLSQNLGSLFPELAENEKGKILIKNLLHHNSGLPDYREYYKRIIDLPPGIRKKALRELLLEEVLENDIGEKTVYSDLGFMILEWVVEILSGRRLDYFVHDEIYKPLGINDLFFVDIDSPESHFENYKGKFAATEQCKWRNFLGEGVVHDDNAFASGGVGGHAGLFGTAMSVHSLLSELLSAYYERSDNHVFRADLVREFLEVDEKTGRALGFDAPSFPDSSCGNFFSNNTVGHLGYTGTSFWMDLEKQFVVILLTNRVHPDRENENIRAFRPVIHDAAAKCFL